MAYKIVFRSVVYTDIDQAAEWYKVESINLSEQFTKNVFEAFASIEKDPERYSKITAVVRRCKVKRFPYIVFFTVSNQQIVVLGVIHARRGNAFIKKRLR